MEPKRATIEVWEVRWGNRQGTYRVMQPCTQREVLRPAKLMFGLMGFHGVVTWGNDRAEFVLDEKHKFKDRVVFCRRVQTFHSSEQRPSGTRHV